jgi:eukaryotic-like serine/threonine-protein kinase
MSSPMAHFKPNDEVEGLRVLDELGQGAASVIYLVQDPRSKQIYAMKHVHRGSHKDDRFLQQAIFEYKVACALDHPNIRRIIRLEKRTKRFFQLEDVFLVMEMLDGMSMDRRPPQNLPDAVSLFLQAAEALKHMHSRGYVHADMKPNNIIIVPGTQGPVAKIIDLGQSCKEGTVKERIQGTPDYIAPEQVHRRAITARTDVYNLGATMYAILTGRTIPTALAKGDSLLSKLDDSMMPKPTPPAQLNPEVPPKLNELIMHCVEIDPGDRPTNMTHVVDRLQLILGQVRHRAEMNPKPADPKGSGSSGLGMTITKDGSTVVGFTYSDPPPPQPGNAV